MGSKKKKNMDVREFRCNGFRFVSGFAVRRVVVVQVGRPILEMPCFLEEKLRATENLLRNCARIGKMVPCSRKKKKKKKKKKSKNYSRGY
jgi:hypothetical protein